MITADIKITNMMDSLARQFQGRVEAYEGSTLALSSQSSDTLKNFAITRTCEEGKFFGFGVSQQIEIHILDKSRVISVGADYSFKAAIGVDDAYTYCFPPFYLDDVSRDENTNELTIKAKDVLAKALEHTTSELEINVDFTYHMLARTIAALIGAAGIIVDDSITSFGVVHSLSSLNFDGSENLRSVLTAIAEATQTIYFVNADNYIVFKRLDKDGDSVFSITKNKYFELKTKDMRTLGTIVHATELGDNLEATTGAGDTQYIRDNLFWELLPSTDVASELDAAIADVGGLSITPFECSWRGNFLVEIGDKIALTTKDDSTVNSYLLNDVITYDGSLSQKTNWEYKENKTETATNPTTIGEKLNQTTAQVDKVRQEIRLNVSETSTNTSAISSLQATTNGISTRVEKVETTTNDMRASVSEEIAALRTEIQQTEADLKVLISEESSTDITEITTTTGFTFNKDGLTIDKSDSEITTRITEDGMTVYKAGEELLTADNQGVIATNLHAKTYLIINGNSRFENYESPFDGSIRTGCFWIGG